MISRARRRLSNAAQRSLEAHGESVHLYRILSHLIRSGATTQKDLAEATSQHPAGVSRILVTLDRRGYVRRARDPHDRRQIKVLVTAVGRARFRALAPLVHEAVAETLAPLPAPDRLRLIGLLRRLLTSSDTVGGP